jgi:hypothetical protein
VEVQKVLGVLEVLGSGKVLKVLFRAKNGFHQHFQYQYLKKKILRHL